MVNVWIDIDNYRPANPWVNDEDYEIFAPKPMIGNRDTPRNCSASVAASISASVFQAPAMSPVQLRSIPSSMMDGTSKSDFELASWMVIVGASAFFTFRGFSSGGWIFTPASMFMLSFCALVHILVKRASKR